MVRPLGSGGSARVYEGIQLSVDRSVALKVFRTADDWAVAAARDEAGNLARLDCEHAITVFDCDLTASGHPVLVLEFASGPTLQGVLGGGGGLSVAEAVLVLTQLARALAAAHRIGLVHGDIKAQNIVLSDSPLGMRLKVLDFGASQLLGAEDGAATGTWKYMAPEQVEGAPVTPAIDVFAAGILLHDMLGDTPRYHDASEAMDAAKRRRRVSLPGKLASSDLGHLLDWMTDPDPSNRCPDGDRLVEAIQKLGVDHANVTTAGVRLAGVGSNSKAPASRSSSSLLRVSAGQPDTMGRSRNAEREELLGALAGLRDGGRGSTIILGGERGLGKRTLLRWFDKESRRALVGVRSVWVAEGAEKWALAILGAIALEDDSRDVRELSTAIAGVCGALTAEESAAILAACGYLLGTEPDPRAIASIVWKASNTPVVIAVAEVGSQPGLSTFLTELDQRLTASPRPVALVLSVDRSRMAASPALARTIAELSRGPNAQIHRLAPLGADEVIELARDTWARSGHPVESLGPRLAAVMVDAACGNPAAVLELCERLYADGRIHQVGDQFVLAGVSPSAPLEPVELCTRLRTSLADRIATLGGSTQGRLLLARRCAMLGRGFDREMLERLLTLEVRSGHQCARWVLDDLSGLLDELVGLDVLSRETRIDFRFSQRLMWRALDAVTDGFADGPKAHTLCGRMKSELFALRGEPPWRLREIESHQARAKNAGSGAVVPGWDGHADCWA